VWRQTGAERGAFALIDFVVNDFVDQRCNLSAQDVPGAVAEQSSTMMISLSLSVRLGPVNNQSDGLASL